MYAGRIAWHPDDRSPQSPGAQFMTRFLAAFVLMLSLIASAVVAQDGPLRRAGQALDRTGKTIRARVESEVARGEIVAQERDVLTRVMRRIEWDKRFVGSTIQIE